MSKFKKFLNLNKPKASGRGPPRCCCCCHGASVLLQGYSSHFSCSHRLFKLFFPSPVSCHASREVFHLCFRFTPPSGRWACPHHPFWPHYPDAAYCSLLCCNSWVVQCNECDGVPRNASCVLFMHTTWQRCGDVRLTETTGRVTPKPAGSMGAKIILRQCMWLRTTGIQHACTRTMHETWIYTGYGDTRSRSVLFICVSNERPQCMPISVLLPSIACRGSTIIGPIYWYTQALSDRAEQPLSHSSWHSIAVIIGPMNNAFR